MGSEISLPPLGAHIHPSEMPTSQIMAVHPDNLSAETVDIPTPATINADVDVLRAFAAAKAPAANDVKVG